MLDFPFLAGSPLVLLLLVLQTVGLSWWDRRRYGVWLTPFILLAVPYTAVVLLAFLVGPLLGFVPLYLPSIWLWVGALPAFWLGGQVPRLLWSGEAVPDESAAVKGAAAAPRFEERSRLPVLGISAIAVLIPAITALRLAVESGGLSALSTDSFTAAYGSGLSGHSLILGQVLILYWIGARRLRDRAGLLALVALLAVNLLYQGKGALMIPLLGGLLYRSFAGRLHLTWGRLLAIGIGGYLLFNLIYLFTFALANRNFGVFLNGERYAALFYHFWAFLFAGVLGFSELLRQNISFAAPPEFLIEPFLNVAAYVLRFDLLHGRIEGFDLITIHPTLGKVTNVTTLFGVMQAALGVVGTLAGAALLGFLLYALFLAAQRLRNCWLAAAYAFLGATLCFGWFSYFYVLLTYLEVFAVCLLFAGLAEADSLLRARGSALPRWGLPLLAAMTAAVLLTAAAIYPAAQRGAASLLLLHGADAASKDTTYARSSLRAAAALRQGDPDVALALLGPPQQLATALDRGIYAQALSAATGDWRTAAMVLAGEQPLPRRLLNDLLVPHMGELSAGELAFWRQRIGDGDPVLQLDLALQLLVAGNYGAAEQWARSLPGYEQSAFARRLVGQALFGRGQYAEAEQIFASLYGEFGDADFAYLYGRTLLVEGRAPEAVPLLEEAAAKTQTFRSWYLADLALAYARSGRCVQAVASAEEALALDGSPELAARIAEGSTTIAALCP